jgi:hypothetical protein
MGQRKQVQGVPAVMVINANVQTNEGKQLWASPNWLPREIGIIVGNGQFFCYEGQDLELHVQRKVHQIQVYELIGVVADVSSAENQKSHLVGMVNGEFSIVTYRIQVLTYSSRSLINQPRSKRRLAPLQRLSRNAMLHRRSPALRPFVETSLRPLLPAQIRQPHHRQHLEIKPRYLDLV